TEREFRHRNLSVRCCTTTAPVEPTNACAAVFQFGADFPEDVLCAANTHARTLVDSGLRIDLVAADDETMGRVQVGSKPVLKLPGVAARTDPPPHSLAEKIARHDAGQRPHSALQIEVAGNREPVRDVD